VAARRGRTRDVRPAARSRTDTREKRDDGTEFIRMSTEGDAPLDVTIITGMSDAGRSEAANVLEDIGFFVIDNLPPALIGKVAELARGGGRPHRYALVVDVRSGMFLDELGASLAELRRSGASTRILFLDASDDALVRRYEATRRRHPLSDTERVSDGITRERDLLEELKGEADVIVDTTSLNVHELRDRLQQLFADDAGDSRLQVNVVSFGYKHGLPLDVDLVFDCRFLPNPHWVDRLRPLPGTDASVREYVMHQPLSEEFLQQLDDLLAMLLPAFQQEGKSYLSIGIGCTGGRHRSVVMAEELAQRLRRHGVRTAVRHRDVARA
jgi:RNase adapter protein RapZ